MMLDNLFNKLVSLVSGQPESGEANLSYTSDGRCGQVHYQGPEGRFAMYYEFGGGNCVACIQVPSVENWEKTTSLPLARREEVLNFIGQQVVKDQTTGGQGHFKIEGDWLNIYV